MTEKENNYTNTPDPADDIFDKSKNISSYRKRNIIIYLIPVIVFAIIWAIFLISSSVKASSYSVDHFELDLTSKENRIDSQKGKIVRVGVNVENNSKHDATSISATLTFKNKSGEELFSANGKFSIDAKAEDTYALLIDLSTKREGGLDALRALELDDIEMEASDIIVYYSDFQTSDSQVQSSGRTTLIIVTVIVLLIWGFIIIFFRCPRCNSLFTLRIIDKEELDRQHATWTKKNPVDNSKTMKVSGDIIKYKVTKECKCCGKIITHDATEKHEW